jgi:mannan endo-1,4-beta-mannosidase
MPDLSKRPERYATAFVAALIVGSFAYSALGVRFGPDSKLAQLQAQNKELQHQLQASPSTSASATAAAVRLRQPMTIAAAISRKNCSAFGNQEAAQKFWNSHKSEYPDWDGNHNGVACEQLKRAKQAAASSVTTVHATMQTTVHATATPATITKIIYQNKKAAQTEPKVPVQVPATPVVTKPTAPSKATIVASRQHFGLYAATADEYNGLESTLARDTTMHGYFQGWDTDFRAASVNSAWTAGEIPFLTWESRPLSDDTSTVDYSLANIIAGGFDTYLHKYASDIKANGLPLIIRFDQEMNGNWYRWDEANPNYSNATGSFIAAWRHVHDIFEEEGANSLVIWDWSPNRIDNIRRMPSIDNYYPGDDYVDWVGMTGYYRPGDAAPTFDSTYSATLNALRSVAPDKPILLSEVGATEIGGHKLAWVTSFFPGLVANPDVIGFVWFNYAVTDAGVTNDWRITSTSAITTAFRTGLYATEFGRDYGKKPVLVTTIPSATASTSSSASASATSTANAHSVKATAVTATSSPTPTATGAPTPTARPSPTG